MSAISFVTALFFIFLSFLLGILLDLLVEFLNVPLLTNLSDRFETATVDPK